ncbi:hypothetical protein ACWC2K_05280 [Streptomyces chattanoogensis]
MVISETGARGAFAVRDGGLAPAWTALAPAEDEGRRARLLRRPTERK